MSDRINLNKIRRTSVSDDGIFHDCQWSDHEFDDFKLIDSQQNMNAYYDS